MSRCTGKAPGMHASASAGRTNASVVVDPGGFQRTFTLTLQVAHPWHVYSPGATSGLPVELSVDEPARLSSVEYLIRSSGETLRRAVITGLVADAEPGTVFRLRTQACDGSRCEAPAVAQLVLEHHADEPGTGQAVTRSPGVPASGAGRP